MADERTKAPYNQLSPVLMGYGWESLRWRHGDRLFDRYRHPLEALRNQKGLQRAGAGDQRIPGRGDRF